MGKNRDRRETETKYANQADFDIRGPTADKLFDVSEIQNRIAYQNVYTRSEEWKFVEQREAEPYMPPAGENKTRRVVFGIKQRHDVELPVRKSVNLDQFMSKKRAHVINTGGSIWGLDFVPKRPEADSEPLVQYLAISGYRGTEEEYHPAQMHQPTGTYKNCIQLWRCELTVNGKQVPPTLDLCLLHDFGIVSELKWCPYGVYEEEEQTESWLPKLGILCAIFGDNTMRLIVVPHPKAVRRLRNQEDLSQPVYMRITRTRCTLTVPGVSPTAIAWGGTNKIACGYSNGYIALYDAEGALTSSTEHTGDGREYLISVSVAHDTMVRDICWHGVDNPVNYASAGTDGIIYIFDCRDPSLRMSFTRVRGFRTALAWPGYDSELITTDPDNVFRSYIVKHDPDLRNGPKKGLSKSHVWSISGSEFHTCFAFGNADGWLKIINMQSPRYRKILNLQNIAYKLDYDREENVFRYIDGLKPMSLDDVKKEPEYVVCIDRFLSIQRVVWCPNRDGGAWVASGGAAGLCRIDFVGRGSDWP